MSINPMTHLKELSRKSLSQETKICYRLKLGVMCGAQGLFELFYNNTHIHGERGSASL